MRKAPSIPPEISPNRYIEKVRLPGGEILDVDIQPRQLLVHYHRDYHIVDILAHRLMSRLVRRTGDIEIARRRMKEIRRLGHRVSHRVAHWLRRNPHRVARVLFGLKDRDYYFRFLPSSPTADTPGRVLDAFKAEGARRLEMARRDERLSLRVLVTGGTGFIGKEILWQLARDPDVEEIAVLIRPKTITDRKTGEVLRVLTPADRGRALLDQLWIDAEEARGKFRFVSGDVEQPRLGISPEEHRHLQTRLTHVIHSAASVAFDDPYETSFRANVCGTLNVLDFSLSLQRAGSSPFVAHVAVETSYIHGRQSGRVAREAEVIFPSNFYNNYYELTKAMASIETERFMLDRGLRVVQLCPAIVIGDSRSGNNRGDAKVVNAPINAFGRAHQTLGRLREGWRGRALGAALARLVFVYPGDPSAELNLVPVDWVARGIVAALKRPQAIGERVHLATDQRLSSEEIRHALREELGVEVALAEPTMHRNVLLPLLTRALSMVRHQRLAATLEKLGLVFSGYSEWGQPVHEVGNDVRLLGLPLPRPRTDEAFRMLCRHNRWVQQYGQIKDADEMSRRERVWWQFVCDLERETGERAGALTAEAFRATLEARLDTAAFVPKARGRVAAS